MECAARRRSAAAMSTHTGEFSVYQEFRDGTFEEVLRFVDAPAAVYRAKALTESVGGTIGNTTRVLILDGGDYVVFEWQYEAGVVFPTEAECAAVMP
jgi:hypothetical protein